MLAVNRCLQLSKVDDASILVHIDTAIERAKAAHDALIKWKEKEIGFREKKAEQAKSTYLIGIGK